MNEEKITALEKKIQKEHGNIAGMVVLKDGRTVYENYFNGCGADDTIHVFSVTKSIVSILAGIAIDRGYIGSVDQKVLDFFPDYTVKRGEKTIQTITLKNLLTMTAPYKFRSAPYTRFFSSEDWVMAALDLLGGRKPAGEFRYMEMIGPDILSGLLSNATGRPVLDFAREALFEPLHIAVASNIVLYTPQEHVAFVKRIVPAAGLRTKKDIIRRAGGLRSPLWTWQRSDSCIWTAGNGKADRLYQRNGWRRARQNTAVGRRKNCLTDICGGLVY